MDSMTWQELSKIATSVEMVADDDDNSTVSVVWVGSRKFVRSENYGGFVEVTGSE